jgi:DNA mismatch repair ATPase MutS
MPTGVPDRDDDPKAIAATVRTLATDAHLVLTRVAAGACDDHREKLAQLMRRIDDLQRLLGQARPGERRLHSLRRWLENLQRQTLIVQQMENLRQRVEWLEGRAEQEHDAS